MSARQHREGRRAALVEADRIHLASKGKASLKWYQRLSLFLFPRGKWNEALKRWQRSNLKRWAHEVATDIEARQRDAKAFRAASKRIRKARLAKLLHKAEPIKGGTEAK